MFISSTTSKFLFENIFHNQDTKKERRVKNLRLRVFIVPSFSLKIFLLVELIALRADFFDRINGIYMISLLFLYPDHPVYLVKKRKFLGYQVISKIHFLQVSRKPFLP